MRSVFKWSIFFIPESLLNMEGFVDKRGITDAGENQLQRHDANRNQGALFDLKLLQQPSEKRFRAVKSTSQHGPKAKVRGLEESSGTKQNKKRHSTKIILEGYLSLPTAVVSVSMEAAVVNRIKISVHLDVRSVGVAGCVCFVLVV